MSLPANDQAISKAVEKAVQDLLPGMVEKAVAQAMNQMKERTEEAVRQALESYQTERGWLTKQEVMALIKGAIDDLKNDKENSNEPGDLERRQADSESCSAKTSKKKDEAPKKKKPAASKHKTPTKKGNNNTTIQQSILDNTNALCVRRGEGGKADRKRVLAMCGFSQETGSCKNAMTKLKKKGYIGFDITYIWLTDAGREQAKNVNKAKSNAEQLEFAKQCLSSSKGKKLLDILSDGKAHSRAEVAKQLDSDPSKPGWKNLLSLIKKEDCLEYCKDDPKNPALRLPDWIFPFGRPDSN